MTLRIGFDDQVFAFQEFGGISRYFVELAARLASRDEVDLRIYAPLYRNRYLAELTGPAQVYGRPVPRIPRTDRVLEILSRSLTRAMMSRSRPDLVHETYYRARSAAPRGIPSVTTVYDMIPEKFSRLFSSSEPALKYKAATVERASRVICVSESTKRDLMELLGVPEAKISVILLGVSQWAGRSPENINAVETRNPLPAGEGRVRVKAPNVSMRSSQARSAQALTPLPQGEGLHPAASDFGAPYFLYVGKRDGYKNFEGLARAYAASPLLSTHFDLVCFGGGPFSAAEADTLRSLGIPPRKVRQVGGGDEALARLYRSAALFVYPSLYEGFGMPPLEAMAAGCPVACSDVASLPEVVGDAARTFDPHHIDSMRAALETFVNDASLRGELIQRGFRRAAAFSWDRCADRTLDLYRGLIG
jgi:glycosyltransferase involved in cell wall biosynthesis